jgi:hypothetical protein
MIDVIIFQITGTLKISFKIVITPIKPFSLVPIKELNYQKQNKMKAIIKTAAVIMLGIIFSCGIIAAQQQTETGKGNEETLKTKSVLTADQKAMLQNNLQKRKELREAFKATLTQQQKDMLTDPRMMKNERIKAFRASLTDQQVNMIKARRMEIKTERSQFRATLTDQQKIQFRKMAANKGRINRAVFIKARLRHRLMGI